MYQRFKKHGIQWVLSLVTLGMMISGFALYKRSSDFLDPAGFSSTPPSNEINIRIMIADLKRSIREQKLDRIDELFDDNFQENDGVKVHSKSDIKGLIDSKFKNRKKREKKNIRTAFSSNNDPAFTPAASISSETTTSDFEIVVDSVAVIDDQNSEVFARFQFVGDLKNRKYEVNQTVKIGLNKKDKEWKLSKSDNLSKCLK